MQIYSPVCFCNLQGGQGTVPISVCSPVLQGPPGIALVLGRSRFRLQPHGIHACSQSSADAAGLAVLRGEGYLCG